MITESDLYHEIIQAQPRFFGPGNSVPDERHLADVWPLPADRILFSCIEHAPGEPDPMVSLHVLDGARQRIKRVAAVAAAEVRSVAIATATAWMQGLRAEDLSSYDADMIDWLGEMAHRLSLGQLDDFSKEYFAIPPDAWGTHDNPDPAPVEHLGEVLSSMGFSDDYLGMHW